MADQWERGEYLRTPHQLLNAPRHALGSRDAAVWLLHGMVSVLSSEAADMANLGDEYGYERMTWLMADVFEAIEGLEGMDDAA